MTEDSFTPDAADKGLENGSCNRTACQAPGADHYNKSTRRWYCAVCASEINWPGGRLDCMKLYGVPLLCQTRAETLPQHLPIPSPAAGT